jgi:hypothetical protein
MTTITYTATNTSLQVIDSFDLPTTQSIYMEVHAVDRSDSSVSTLTINHSGIEISETQSSVSVSGSMAPEITTAVSGNTGQIKIEPQRAPTEYTITREIRPANLYSETTVSGRIIKGSEGVGIYFTGSANNMTVRQANNNSFGNSNAFITANTLGPIMTKTQYYSSNTLVSYNGSDVTSNTNYTLIVSSGQPRNNHYIEVPTVAGTKYRVQANAFYVFDSVQGRTETNDIGARIAVGTTQNSEDIAYQIVDQTETQYNVDFTATANTTYVGFGFGALGSTVALRSVSIRELVPFHTYHQEEGTVYLKWNVIAAGSTILTIGNNSVAVDAANNVFVNTVNCGSQQAVNKIAYRYSQNSISYSFNGSAANQQTVTYYSDVTQAVFVSPVEEFSYTPTLVGNTTLAGLTNV